MLSFSKLKDDDLEFLLETRNECREFLHNNTKFDLDGCVDWFKTTKNKYYTIQNNGINIGYFTKANLDEVYHHIKHGIEFGEVGFPSELNENGFTFLGLLSNRKINKSFVDYLS